MKTRKPKIAWPPSDLGLPDDMTLEALGELEATERRIQAERQEEIRRAGGVFDPITKTWIAAR